MIRLAAVTLALIGSSLAHAQQLIVNLNHVEEDDRTAAKVRDVLAPLVGNAIPFAVVANSDRHGPDDVYVEFSQYAPSVRRGSREFDVQLTMTMSIRGQAIYSNQYREINRNKVAAVEHGMAQLCQELVARLPRGMVPAPAPQQPRQGIPLPPAPRSSRYVAPGAAPSNGAVVIRKIITASINRQPMSANLGRVELAGLSVDELLLQLDPRLTYANVDFALDPEFRLALQDAPFDFVLTLKSRSSENGPLVVRGRAAITFALTYGSPRIEFGGLKFQSLDVERAPLGGELLRSLLNRQLPDLLRKQTALHEQAAKAINEEIRRATGEAEAQPAPAPVQPSVGPAVRPGLPPAAPVPDRRRPPPPPTPDRG
jgi:hypothetical protein